MLISKLDRLKTDLDDTRFFILRLEKEGAIDRIPFFRIKLQTIIDSIHSLEKKRLQ